MKEVLIIAGAAEDERPTLPPAALDDHLDDELHSFIHERKNPRDRVLVVDDDHAILEALAGLLEDAGYEVDVASGGREAMMKILGPAPEPDVILLDWMMPGVGGDAVHDFLKRSPQYRHIPILIITAQPHAVRDLGAMYDPGRVHVSDPTKEAKLAARRGSKPPPATEVVPKPLEPIDVFLGKVKGALDRARGRTP